MTFKLGTEIYLHDDYVKIPSVSTAQRDALTAENGMLVYNNTLSVLQQYSNGNWQSIEPPPIVTSISPTSFDGNAGASITINGSNFSIGATVQFIDNNAQVFNASTVTRVNGSQLVAVTPTDFTVAGEPYSVKVTNLSGLSATLSGALDAGGLPSWNTPAGTIATVYDESDNYSPTATISATDPDGSAVTYSVQSGSLYGNGSLNSSNGQITGNPTNVSSSTTYSFTAAATDNASNTSTRTFSIIVNPLPDGSSSGRAATSALDLYNLGITTDGYYWINVSGSPQQVHCLLSSSFIGGFGSNASKAGWTLFAQSDSATSLNIDIATTTGTITQSTSGTWARGAWKQGFDSSPTYSTETEVLVDIDGAHTLVYNGWRGISLSLANSQIDILRGYTGSYQVLRNGEADWNNVTYTSNREGAGCSSCYRPHYKVHNENYGNTYTQSYTNSHNGTNCSDWCQDGYGLVYTQRILPYLSRSGSCFSGGGDPCGYQGVSLGPTGTVARFYFRER